MFKKYLYILSILIVVICFIFGGYYCTKLFADYRENYDVDLVYLWVDGNEPEFKKLKNFYQKKENVDQHSLQGHYEQVDELKYSLRSVEKYMPWINHIYIVTNGQIPKWLDLNNPKITLVDVQEIVPQKYLPIFNSCAIESVMYKIPNLSEHFIYSNDDMFVNRPVKKSFFFRNGKVIVRLAKSGIPPISTYSNQLWYAISLIERDFGNNRNLYIKKYAPHHNMDAYLKSDYENCAKHFNKEYTETLTHRFRKKTSIQRHIVSLWSYYQGHAKIKEIPPIYYGYEPKNLDSMFYFNNQPNYEDWLIEYNPALFCINDLEDSVNEDRMRTKTFLEKRFPQKSKFEK